MKVIIIPDLHGKSCWEKVDISLYDKVIFLGDYVDCFKKSDSEIILNLNNIIEFKKNNYEKVELLLGNHDFPYLFPNESFRCSGFRRSYANILTEIYKNNIDLFKVAFQIEDYLFTHAGVSKYWYDMILFKESKYVEYLETYNVSEVLNSILKTSDKNLFWSDLSPIWIRPESLINDLYNDYYQIVGHTKMSDIIIHTDNKRSVVVFTDILDSIEKFYEIEI